MMMMMMMMMMIMVLKMLFIRLNISSENISSQILRHRIGGVFRTFQTSKMELFVIRVDGF